MANALKTARRVSFATSALLPLLPLLFFGCLIITIVALFYNFMQDPLSHLSVENIGVALKCGDFNSSECKEAIAESAESNINDRNSAAQRKEE